MGINWNYPTTMWIGENRIEDLSLACKELNISNPLFVTDKDLINLDLTKNIILTLKKSFKNLATFSRCWKSYSTYVQSVTTNMGFRRYW